VLLLCGILAAGSWLGVAQGVRAAVFFTVRDLLAQQFKASEHVSYVKVRPTLVQRQRVERQLGHALAKPEYVFYVAKTGEHTDGYALFDEERGQHELISFATFFDPRGAVVRVEVVAYREPFGDGVRAERFRRQFNGRDARSHYVLDKDIDAISGATISSRALCKGVERASVLLEVTLLSGHPPSAQAAQASAGLPSQ
jgi:Na+-translocating ferredoxin:NAD+ oxidoreductase RnfG subunit